MKTNLLGIVCLAVLGTILTLGLWPFHSTRNDVSWVANHDGLRFGRYGTVRSSGPLQITTPQNNLQASLEIWLQPNRIWDSGTVLSFSSHTNLFQFSLRQSQADLLLRTEVHDDQHRRKTASLYVKDAFSRKSRPVFVTISAGVQGTCVYIDGVPATTAPRFPLSVRNFSGQLVLGDSAGQPDSWSGQLLGLAIYDRQLTATQVVDNYETWKRELRPEIDVDEHRVALYLFNEHTGNVVRDSAHSGVDLYIPERYQVVDKIVLEPFWTEFRMSRSYWGAVLKNIVGFIPFGFCYYAYLATLPSIKRPTLVTVALGTVVSFTIEVLQAFLPTRESGTTDLITNTLGTWVGVEAYNLLTPVLNRFSSGVPFGTIPYRRRKGDENGRA
jgi:hypothetical protein